MSAQAILDTMVQTGNQIDNQWSMYIVVHLGLFWFFFLVHRPLLFVERVVALFAYCAFAVINGGALIGSYNFLEAMRLDILSGFPNELANTPRIMNTLEMTNFADKGSVILITHGVGFLVVAMFVLFRNTMIKRYQRLYPAERVQT